MPRSSRRAFRTVIVVVVGLAAAVALTRGQSGQQQQQRPPVFRTGTNAVLVDAYPRRDGAIVEGLTKEDFTLTEEGVPQKIDTLEFIRIAPNSPEVDRVDPNTQREANALAADPRNRVFVLFLDHYHANLAGGHSVRGPILEMLNRMLAPNDLFGVATVFTRPVDLILGRRTTTLESQLMQHWDWGIKHKEFEPEEQAIVRCYGEQVAWRVAARLRERRTMENLRTLIRHLGDLREARKVLLLFTDGWPMYEPDLGAVDEILESPLHGRRPQVGVSTLGQLTTARGLSPVDADLPSCHKDMIEAFNLDNRRRYITLIEDAVKANVSVYPVSLQGMLGGKTDMFWEFANNTDGGVVATNDYRAGLRKVADDVSAYYVLTYSPTNTVTDGTFRRIEVKVKQPGVRVSARRGYFAPEPPRPEGQPAAVEPLAAGLDRALGALARLRPDARLFTRAALGAQSLAVTAELATASVAPRGADVQVSVTSASGQATSAEGRIEAGQRGLLVQLPRPEGQEPYRVVVRVEGGEDRLLDEKEARAAADSVLGDPVVYRATPSARSPLWPVADMQFRRTERVHLEWTLTGDDVARSARLLGRDGRPLTIPVTLSTRTEEGRRLLVADLNLAPLAVGDYVIAIGTGGDSGNVESYVAIRVRN